MLLNEVAPVDISCDLLEHQIASRQNLIAKFLVKWIYREATWMKSLTSGYTGLRQYNLHFYIPLHFKNEKLRNAMAVLNGFILDELLCSVITSQTTK
jgi:hypothetical protein